MTTNLIDVLRKSFTKESYHDISEYVGINPESTKNGINALIPAFLASILGNNTTNDAVQPTWWNALKDDYPQIENEFVDTTHIDTSSFLIKGREVLSGMFRTNHDDLVASISSVAGVQKEKATGLIEIVVPLLMGFLTNWMRTKEWKFTDLITNLLEQKSTITKSLPMGLSTINFGVNDMVKDNLSKTPEEEVLDTTKTDFSRTMEVPIPTPSVTTSSEPLEENIPQTPKDNLSKAPKEDVFETPKDNIPTTLKNEVFETPIKEVLDTTKTDFSRTIEAPIPTPSVEMSLETQEENIPQTPKDNISKVQKKDVFETPKDNIPKTPKNEVFETPIKEVLDTTKTDFSKTMEAPVPKPTPSAPTSSEPSKSKRRPRKPKTLILKSEMSKSEEPPVTSVRKTRVPAKESAPKKTRNGLIWLIGLIMLGVVLWYFLR